MVPLNALSNAFAVPSRLGALGEEPPARDAPLLRGPVNAHVTLQFVLQRTLQGAIEHSKRSGTWVWLETEEGAGQLWTVGNRAAAMRTILGSAEALEGKHIKASGGLLGSVVYEVLYHRWADHGLTRV